MTSDPKEPQTAGQILKALPRGASVSLRRLGAGKGSLEARKSSAGDEVLFLWRFTQDGKTDRMNIGAYDPAASPQALTPSPGGYSVKAALRAAEALQAQHQAAIEAGDGGLRAQRAAEARQRAEDKARAAAEAEAAAAEQAARRVRESVTVGEAWATYLQERKAYWGERHYLDHVNMAKAGGEVKGRGTRGLGRTLPGPLHELMGLLLVDLTAEVVEAWARRHAADRPTAARLGLRHLRAFVGWCEESPAFKALMPAVNPTGGKRTREALGKPGVKADVLLREQLPEWFAAVRNIGNPVVSAYLQVLLLTGARPGEVLTIRWEDVNTQWRGLTIRDKVEGARVIPLTPYVARLLAGLPRRNDWVFSSASSKGGMLTVPRSHHVCACKVAGIDGLTLHGLRRSFKSLTEWLDCPAGVVAQIMGHKPSATAEKHYTVRPLDLLRLHHERIEAWMLEQAGIAFVADAQAGRLRAVA